MSRKTVSRLLLAALIALGVAASAGPTAHVLTSTQRLRADGIGPNPWSVVIAPDGVVTSPDGDVAVTDQNDQGENVDAQI